MTQSEAQGRSKLLGPLAVTGVLALAGMLAWSTFGQDVRFCKRVFAGLVTGDQSVRKMIDWSHFIALDTDVGAVYAQLPKSEQLLYQQAFVRNFSLGFAASKADPSAFTNWRVQENGTVAVDYPAKNKVVIFKLSENGKQVVGLVWK